MTFQELGISINAINGRKDMNINNPPLVQEKEFMDSDTLRNLLNRGQKPNNKKNHKS
ncbi:MAG: hypothetical protein KGD73_10580 [Candidatus Lokiarchaeota archaeon]|nr:hypothetical protein [Candidatus Lokiarchaeota archaeon]